MSAPYPAIDPDELGVDKAVLIDRLLIPYFLGTLEALANPALYEGDGEDVIGTVLAVQDHLARLANAEDAMPTFTPEGCALIRTAQQSAPSTTETLITWQAAQWDTSEFFKPTVNANRAYFPSDGFWFIGAQVGFSAAAATGGTYIRCRRNASLEIARVKREGNVGATTFEFGVVKFMAAGDFVDVAVRPSVTANIERLVD